MANLLHGPYRAPSCRRGDWIEDERLGLVEVGGWTAAPIPWPYRKRTGRPQLILTDELARAVRCEGERAIADSWGVSVTTVWSWRKVLGVGRITAGTRRLLQQDTGVPPDAAARGRERAAAPDSVARMAATKRGRPAHPATRAALLAAAKAPRPDGWGERANAWMQRAKRPPE